MSLAYSLVNSLAETETEEDLTTLVIDHYTREIRIPKGITTLGVEYDDDVLRLNFKIPRYLGTVDLYNFSIRINYINANGDDDVYKVTDKAVVGDNITFSWLVGPTAVAYKGNTRFNVCMVITDSNSTIKQEYNTAPASLPVKEGLECSERVVSEYTDILEQWERRLFGIGDTEEAKLLVFSEEQQANIVEKGKEVLATIPEDYQTITKLANDSIRTKADAIICSTQGETISVSDSSDDYLRGLRVFGKTTQATTTGKNLCSLNDITFTQMEHVNLVNPIPAGTYYLSLVAISTDTDDTSCVINFYNNDGHVGGARFERGKRINSQITLTHDATEMYCYASESFIAGENDEATFSNIMVSIDENSYYEPYTGGVASPSPEWPQKLNDIGFEREVNLFINGNNFFNPHNAINISSTTTVGEDGWITVDVPANSNNPFSNLFTPSDDRIIVGRKYVIKCEVKEIKNGSLHYMSVHTESGGSSQFHKTYSADNAGTFKTVATAVYSPSEAAYMLRGYFGITDSTVAAKCVYRIWVYPAELGDVEYKPYAETQTITSTRILPGIPVSQNGNYTDSDGQQWICDEIDFERGVYIQSVGIHTINYVYIPGITKTSNGLKWVYGTSIKDSALHLTGISAVRCLMNTKFQMVPHSVEEEMSTGTIMSAYGHGDNLEFRFRLLVSDYETAELVEQAILGTMIYYPLATPIKTPLSEAELTAFRALKTNYPNTTIINDAGAWMAVRYNADTETWINNMIDTKIAAAVAKL